MCRTLSTWLIRRTESGKRSEDHRQGWNGAATGRYRFIAGQCQSRECSLGHVMGSPRPCARADFPLGPRGATVDQRLMRNNATQ